MPLLSVDEGVSMDARKWTPNEGRARDAVETVTSAVETGLPLPLAAETAEAQEGASASADLDRQFWQRIYGGYQALLHGDVWIAEQCLQALTSDHVRPLEEIGSDSFARVDRAESLRQLGLAGTLDQLSRFEYAVMLERRYLWLADTHPSLRATLAMPAVPD